jgi:hypothetical protein
MSAALMPQQVLDKMTDCSQCRGHDEHTQCEMNYHYLQEWMESVEARLAQLARSVDHPRGKVSVSLHGDWPGIR